MMFALKLAAVCYGLKFSLSHFFDPYKKPMEEIFAAKSRQITTFPAGKIGGGAGGKNQFGKRSVPNLAAFGARFLLPAIKKLRTLSRTKG